MQDNIDLFTAFSTITPCKDGSYCCDNGTLANECCDHNLGVFVVNGTATNIKPPTISQETHMIPARLSTSSELILATSFSNSSIATTSLFSPTSTVFVSGSARSSSSYRVDLIVGCAIGTGAVAILIISARLLLNRRRLKIRTKSESPQKEPQDIHELDARMVRELAGGEFHVEMQ